VCEGAAGGSSRGVDSRVERVEGGGCGEVIGVGGGGLVVQTVEMVGILRLCFRRPCFLEGADVDGVL
jgi:hypothetical protein